MPYHPERERTHQFLTRVPLVVRAIKSPFAAQPLPIDYVIPPFSPMIHQAVLDEDGEPAEVGFCEAQFFLDMDEVRAELDAVLCLDEESRAAFLDGTKELDPPDLRSDNHGGSEGNSLADLLASHPAGEYCVDYAVVRVLTSERSATGDAVDLVLEFQRELETPVRITPLGPGAWDAILAHPPERVRNLVGSNCPGWSEEVLDSPPRYEAAEPEFNDDGDCTNIDDVVIG